MVRVTISRFTLLRSLTTIGVLVIITLPSLSIIVGASGIVVIQGITILSPFEFALLNLETKNWLPNLVFPVLISSFIIVLFGRFLCGWICPVGILLESSHHFTEKKKRAYNSLRQNSEKYMILLSILGSGLILNFSLLPLFSPPGIIYRMALTYFIHGVMGADLILLLIILVIDLAAIRFGRTWCNTICPLGATISSLSIVNLIKPKINRDKCINCLECERICPMRIPLIHTNKWSMTACTKCFKCLNACSVGAINIAI